MSHHLMTPSAPSKSTAMSWINTLMHPPVLVSIVISVGTALAVRFWYRKETDANPKPRTEQSSLLRIALMQNNTKDVKALLAVGASVAERNDVGGDTALHTAAKWDRAEMAKLLIASRGDVNDINTWGVTPLHCAASSSAYETARVLCDAGASTDIKSADGRVAYELAKDDRMRALCGGASLAIFRALESRGHAAIEALVNSPAGYDVSERKANGDSVLTFAVQVAIDDRASGLKLLTTILRASSETTQACLPKALVTPGRNGLLPLHLAAAERDGKLMQALLAAGAPVNAQALSSQEHKSALHAVLEEADGDATDGEEVSPNAIAEIVAAVGLLISHHADVNMPDSKQLTPLRQAVDRGLHEVRTYSTTCACACAWSTEHA